MSSLSPLLTQVVSTVVSTVVEPSGNTQSNDGWWTWVALSFIALLVLSGGWFAFMILRSWVMEE